MDLVAYAIQAWESGWGYLWGTFGGVLTDSLFVYKLKQYPSGVGNYADFIRENWLGGHTADCAGLIKGYGWLDTTRRYLDACELEMLESRFSDDFVLKLLYEIINKSASRRERNSR